MLDTQAKVAANPHFNPPLHPASIDSSSSSIPVDPERSQPKLRVETPRPRYIQLNPDAQPLLAYGLTDDLINDIRQLQRMNPDFDVAKWLDYKKVSLEPIDTLKFYPH